MTTSGSTPPAGRSPADERRDGSFDAGLLAVDWRLVPVDDATLVTVQVTNDHDAPREARVENRLDGAVLAPRRHGVPESGWDDAGLTRRVPAGGTVSLGYACRAPPETPPVAVSDAPAGDDPGPDPVDRALRTLDDHAPPRAVVAADAESGRSGPAAGDDGPGEAESESGPVEPTGSESTDCDAVERADSESTGGSRAGQDGSESTDCDAVERADSESTDCDAAAGSAPESARSGRAGVDGTPRADADEVPRTVAAWFDAVEARADAADRLGGDVREATPVLASIGGREGVAVLADRLAADEAALRRVAARASELADRVDGTTVPDLEGDR